MEQRINRNLKRIIGGFIVIIALVLGVCGYGYSAYDWFKSTKQIYLEAEASAYNAAFKSFNEQQQKLLAQAAEMDKRTVYSKSDITFSTQNSLAGDPTAQILIDMLKNSKLTVESGVDTANKQQYTKADLILNGASPLTAEFFTNQGQFGFGVPTLSGTYAVMHKQDREQGDDAVNIPEPLSASELLQALQISEHELAPILKDYAAIYADILSAEDVTISEGTFVEDDTKITGTQYTVKMDQAKYEQFLNRVADKLVDDRGAKDFIYNKYVKIAGLYQDSGYGMTIVTREQFEKNLAEQLQAVKDNQKENPVKGLQMVVQSNPEGKIVERRFTTLEAQDYTARIASWQDGGRNYIILAYSDIRNNATQQYKLDYTDSDVALDFDVRPNGADRFKGRIHYTETQSDTAKTDYEMKAELHVEMKQENEIDIELGLEANGFYQYDVPVALPVIDAGNSVDLLKAPQADVQKFYQELQMGFGQFILKNPALLEAFFVLMEGESLI